jgi:hypothetical protein
MVRRARTHARSGVPRRYCAIGVAPNMAFQRSGWIGAILASRRGKKAFRSMNVVPSSPPLNARPLGARLASARSDGRMQHPRAGERARMVRCTRPDALPKHTNAVVRHGRGAQHGVPAERLDRGDFGSQTQQKGFSNLSA